MKRQRGPWAGYEIELVRQFYADVPTALLAEELGRTTTQVYQKAAKLGLHKSAAFMASDRSGRVQRGKQHPRMRASQFKHGLVPWNKGTHFVAGGRSAETRFKKGHLSGRAAEVIKPIGAERISKDGYLQRKVNNDLPFQQRWKSVHQIVWEQQHGPVPAGHIVVFKAGTQTAIADQIALKNLELISWAENMRRNTRHRWPPELNALLARKAALTRRINRKARELSE